MVSETCFTAPMQASGEVIVQKDLKTGVCLKIDVRRKFTQMKQLKSLA